jgi:DNA-binding beta-propeller fold protein YncE
MTHSDGMKRLAGKRPKGLAAALILAAGLLAPLAGTGDTDRPAAGNGTDPGLVWPAPPQLARIRYLGSVANPADTGRVKGFWRKVWDFVRGEDEDERIVRPMAVAVDGKGRLLVTDSAAKRVHVFDRQAGEYFAIRGTGQELLLLPVGLAVDGSDRIYVADGERRKIHVFNPDGSFSQSLGGDQWLKRPTGLAIDPVRQRLYVVDTPSHDVKVFDLASGMPVKTLGRRGEGEGEFNFPTYAALDRGGRLYVTDSLNMRVQVFDAQGGFVTAFGKHGDGSGDFSAPKGVAVDSEGHIYVADAGFDNIQIFDGKGQLLLYLGGAGQSPGQFWLPTGLFIDGRDRIYAADSYNSRVQIFQYLNVQSTGKPER